jgi:hypothetical protein
MINETGGAAAVGSSAVLDSMVKDIKRAIRSLEEYARAKRDVSKKYWHLSPIQAYADLKVSGQLFRDARVLKLIVRRASSAKRFARRKAGSK